MAQLSRPAARAATILVCRLVANMKSSAIPLSLPLALCLFLAGASCSSNKTAAPERGETAASAPTETLRIPRVGTIQTAGGGSVSKLENGWKIDANGGGTFAAAVPIPSYGPGQWAGSVVVRIRVTKGKIGLGLLTTDGDILKEQTVAPGADVRNVSLPIASNENVKALLLRGLEPKSTSSEAFVETVDLALPAVKLPDGVSLARFASAQGEALIESGPRVRVVTTAVPWTYGAALPLALDNPRGALFLRAKVTTIRGEPYIGILNRDQKDFQIQEPLPPGPDAQEVVVYIPSPATAGSVIVRNGAKNGVSEARIEDVAIYSLK